MHWVYVMRVPCQVAQHVACMPPSEQDAFSPAHERTRLLT